MAAQLPLIPGMFPPMPTVPMIPRAVPSIYTQKVEADESIPPNQTLYIKNLNDRIKVKILKPELQRLFEKFGKILDIVAMSSFWRKGQAWIVYDNIESAKRAMDEMQGYMLYGHAMRINYAFEQSDVVTKANNTFVARPAGPKKPRAIKEREERQQKLFQEMQSDFINGNLEAVLQHSDPETAKSLAAAQARAAELAITAAARKPQIIQRQQVPDHSQHFAGKQRGFLSSGTPKGVPNRILFVESLPEGVTTGDVHTIFCHMPGYIESRVIPSRRVAFVDFDNEHNSGYAMHILQGHNMNGSIISINYAKH